jgi:glutamate dehydrogenase
MSEESNTGNAQLHSDSFVAVTPDAGGYFNNPFMGKQEQRIRVCEHITAQGFVPKDLVPIEVNWFYQNLGIDDQYFEQESIETISAHIMSLYSAKMFAYIKNQNALDINLERETDKGAVYIHSSQPGVSQLAGPQHEQRIDDKYLDGKASGTFRLESFRSFGQGATATQLRCYFVSKCNFTTPDPTPEQATDISLVSDTVFWEKATEHTKEIYSELMKSVLKRKGPVIEMFHVPNSKEKRLVIGFKQRATQSLFSAMSDLYHYYDLYSTRKYVGNDFI